MYIYCITRGRVSVRCDEIFQILCRFLVVFYVKKVKR